jgi:O-antigen ligase
MIVIAVVIIIGIATVFTSASFMGDFASVVGRNSTLTGRTEIWAGLLPIAMQKPILGSGFGGFWTWQTRTVHGVSEAHNGYLEVLLDLGFSGILFVSFFLLSSCRKAYKELFRNFDFGVLWISFIMMTVVYNITASSINSFCNPLMAILLFLSVSSKDFPV